MQSLEPGSGISSTLMPSAANHPILVAIANGATDALTVREHQPTRTLVCADAMPAAHISVSPARRAIDRKRVRALRILGRFYRAVLGFCPWR